MLNVDLCLKNKLISLLWQLEYNLISNTNANDADTRSIMVVIPIKIGFATSGSACNNLQRIHWMDFKTIKTLSGGYWRSSKLRSGYYFLLAFICLEISITFVWKCLKCLWFFWFLHHLCVLGSAVFKLVI